MILTSLLVLLAIGLIVHRTNSMRPVAAQLVRETLASYRIPADQIEAIARPVQTIADFNRLKDNLEREHSACRLSDFSTALFRSCRGRHQSSYDVAIAVFQMALNGKMVHPALTEFAVNNVVDESLLLGVIKRDVEHKSTFDRGHRFLLAPSTHSVTCRNELFFVDWKTCEVSDFGASQLPGDFLAEAALSLVNPHRKLQRIPGVIIADQPVGWSQVAAYVRSREGENYMKR
jgi:hypothetical protein